jgi:hypothetical protein
MRGHSDHLVHLVFQALSGTSVDRPRGSRTVLGINMAAAAKSAGARPDRYHGLADSRSQSPGMTGGRGKAASNCLKRLKKAKKML